MVNQDNFEVLIWAESLANQYYIGINTVVDAYIKANKELGNKEASKQFIETEMKSLMGREDV